jgi:hypothetical protein
LENAVKQQINADGLLADLSRLLWLSRHAHSASADA